MKKNEKSLVGIIQLLHKEHTNDLTVNTFPNYFIDVPGNLDDSFRNIENAINQKSGLVASSLNCCNQPLDHFTAVTNFYIT